MCIFFHSRSRMRTNDGVNQEGRAPDYLALDFREYCDELLTW